MTTRRANQQLLLPTDEEGGGGGGGAPNPSPAPPPAWYGDSHKDFVATKGWKSGDDAITSVQNLEKLLGADRAGRTFVVPKDANDAEGIKSFRKAIGVPDKHEDYALPVPNGQSDNFAKLAATWMHKHGVPKDAAVALVGDWNAHIEKLVADGLAADKAHSDKQLGDLKTKWAGNFDKNSEHARRFMAASGWDDAKVKRYEEAFGTAAMLEDFYAMGQKLGEAGFTPGDGNGAGGMTKKQAQEQIEANKIKRAEGKMSQDDYLKEMERLGPIAHAA